VGKNDASAGRDPLIGQIIAGRFELERRIGSGGMGLVYRALQADMDRRVAVKVLHPELSDDPETKERFNREMRATTRIEHPNSVRVYEHGEHAGRLYLAMELCEGRPLEDLIAVEAPLDPARTASIGMQIAQALAAAHEEKIVHRDLKPENVMLVDRYGQKEVVKVLDFGLARVGENESGDSRLTASGVRVGTPSYMAPEYVTTFAFDHRSDLYALGVILYRMSTGKLPFSGRPFEIIEQAVTGTAPSPASLAPLTTPPWLDELIVALMAKNPADRPRSAQAVFVVLERGRAEHTVADAPPAVANRVPLVACGVIAAVVVGLAAIAAMVGVGLAFSHG
jgi:serine/threonine protein kinase